MTFNVLINRYHFCLESEPVVRRIEAFAPPLLRYLRTPRCEWLFEVEMGGSTQLVCHARDMICNIAAIKTLRSVVERHRTGCDLVERKE